MMIRFCDWCRTEIGKSTADFATVNYPSHFIGSESVENSDDVCSNCYEEFMQLIRVRKQKSENDQRRVPR